MSAILEYLGQQTTLIDEKIEAGTATPDELEMRKGLDGITGNIIELALTTINSQGTDITMGSEEERFINHAGNVAVNIKDSAAKEALSTSLQNITDSAGVNKENLANRVNNLLITIR